MGFSDRIRQISLPAAENLGSILWKKAEYVCCFSEFFFFFCKEFPKLFSGDFLCILIKKIHIKNFFELIDIPAGLCHSNIISSEKELISNEQIGYQVSQQDQDCG